MDIVLLNGGGVDSLAAALILKNSGHTLHSLHVQFDYPASASMVVAAKAIADAYCADQVVVTVAGLVPWGMNAPEATPTGRYRSVPNLQLVVSGIAASYATRNGYSYIANGVKNQEVWGNGFEPAISALIANHNHSQLKQPLLFMRPLSALDDAAVYALVAGNSVLNQTVSCLSSPPCGTCFKCLLRKSHNLS